MGNTSVVYQNINATEVCMDSLHHFGSIFKAGSIGSIRFGLYAQRFDFFSCSFSIFVNHQVSECYISSFLSEL